MSPVRASLRALLVTCLFAVLACVGCSAEQPEGGSPDARLQTHAVIAGDATAEGLAYIESIADVHRRADASPDRSAEILREGLEVSLPPNDGGELEILRLELAARLCENLHEQPGGAAEAVEVLSPMLSPERSLPLHRSTARALVALGDAAVKTGDDALAAGSYMRAIRMMSMLREELEP